jgi:serine/threonine protein kinase
MNKHKVIKDLVIMNSIGKGAFSEVYEGILKEETRERKVAVKVIPKTNLNTKTIDDEIRILKQIKHPNVVNFINQYHTKNNTYIITELCSLGTFRKFVSANYQTIGIPEDHAKKYFKQVCMGVKELHRLNIVHRDLKPDNIFITSKYMLKIGDFGFAKVLGDNDILSSFKGTPINMAPEIFKTNKNLLESYNKKCDIWSLGTILYELIYGKMIVTNIKTIKELQSFLLSEEELALPDDKKVSIECKDLLYKMLRKNPKERLDIDGILSHPWINSSSEGSMNASILIKSYFHLNNEAIQELSQTTFETDRLKEFICLSFKQKLRDSLKDLAANIKDKCEKTGRVVSSLISLNSPDKNVSELICLVRLKILTLIEKFSNVQVGVLDPSNKISVFIGKLIDEQLKQFELTKIYEQTQKACCNDCPHLVDHTSDDVIGILGLKILEIFEKLFKEEFNGSVNSSDHIDNEYNINLQKALLKALESAFFDFVGFSYEIKFNKDLKGVTFDAYNMENYLDGIDDIDEDDFNDSEFMKLKNLFSLKVFTEVQENYPNGKIWKGLSMFMSVLRERLVILGKE